MTRARGERLQIMLAPQELTAVDDFRFKKPMPSRAAAVRELLNRGLRAEGFLTAEPGAHSADFGVIDRASHLRVNKATRVKRTVEPRPIECLCCVHERKRTPRILSHL